MNRYVSGAIALALCGVLSHPAVADTPSWLQVAQSLPNSTSANPYNSPVRRANPNSMQGTKPSAPVIRGPNTVPVQRAPTLDNGGIGNRYPQPQPPAGTTPTFIPNPPHRDAQSSD